MSIRYLIGKGERPPLSTFVKVDDERDEVLIDGVRIAGEVFRTLIVPTPPGRWIRILSVDEVIQVESKQGPIHAE